jgi:hypothetical protein
MNRGQTNTDFVLGVSLMLLAVAFVLVNAPGVFSIAEGSVDSVREQEASRAAAYLVTNNSVAGTSNELRFGEPGGINETFAEAATFTAFTERAGLASAGDRRAAPTINVTLVPGSEIGTAAPAPIVHDGETMRRGESLPGGTSIATTSRVVTLSTGAHCDPTCRLIVRVW